MIGPVRVRPSTMVVLIVTMSHTPDVASLPTYAELKTRTDAPPGSSWGVWGPDDELGTLNLLSDGATRRAAANVRTGQVFPLGLPLEEPRTNMAHRTRPVHHILRVGHQARGDRPGGHDDTSGRFVSRDDFLDGLYLQGSSQWDGLSHVRHPRHGNYNAVPDTDIHEGHGARLGIDRWAHRGIVGRCLLLDVARALAADGRSFPPDTAYPITVADLDQTLDWQDVRMEAGDVLLLHTGWMQGYLEGDLDYQTRVTQRGTMVAPGLAPDEDLVAWLWNHRVAAVAADNIGVEVCPSPDPRHPFPLHERLLPLLGMPMGEYWALHELARACASDRRYDALLVSVPLNIRGAIGSPPQAVAIR
jgi:kynurenine formamidase